MYTITIKGEASPRAMNSISEDDVVIEDLSILDGIDCQEEFSDYFHKEEASLKKKGVSNGYMRFEVENNKLYTITEYNSNEELTPLELSLLAEYTQGQWSDGIGEGFEQYPYMTDGDIEYYISPWDFGQELSIEQHLTKQ